MQYEPAQRWGSEERIPSVPDLYAFGSAGSCEPWAPSSVSSIADLARAQALGKPQSSKKAARPEDIFPDLAFSSSSAAASGSHDRWAPLPVPPRPARFARFSRFFGAGESDQALARFLGVVTDVEKEPLIEGSSERASTWAALRARVGAAPPPPPGRCHCLWRRLPSCTLSYRQRLVGFCVCIGCGLLLSLTSLLSFGALLAGNPTPFAFKYTLGSLLSMSASSFLVGPAKQCEGMCAPVRRFASLLYVASLCATLFCIFRLHDRLLTSIAMCLQLAAMVWYCLTYVPFGGVVLRRCLGSVCKT